MSSCIGFFEWSPSSRPPQFPCRSPLQPLSCEQLSVVLWGLGRGITRSSPKGWHHHEWHAAAQRWNVWRTWLVFLCRLQYPTEGLPMWVMVCTLKQEQMSSLQNGTWGSNRGIGPQKAETVGPVRCTCRISRSPARSEGSRSCFVRCCCLVMSWAEPAGLPGFGRADGSSLQSGLSSLTTVGIAERRR